MIIETNSVPDARTHGLARLRVLLAAVLSSTIVLSATILMVTGTAAAI